MQNAFATLEAQSNKFNFGEFKDHFRGLNSWGLFTAVDCRPCNHKTIRSNSFIEKYIYELYDLIEMKRFGDPIIVFGEDLAASGYSITVN